jgi:EAL domain-containing protein (putative c-di-GMP-specific phosphodiesterase class I)
MRPALDRWVIRHLVVRHGGITDLQKAIYSINLSGASISDPEFPAFAREQFRSHPLQGTQICFELPEVEALSRPVEGANLIRQLKQDGCLFALSGVGRDPLSVDLLKRMRVDFLKISGDIILNILREPADLAKVAAINRVAHTMGMRTIAEFVENEQTLVKLRELQVDMAQGFGISRPRSIDELRESQSA